MSCRNFRIVLVLIYPFLNVIRVVIGFDLSILKCNLVALQSFLGTYH
jgi:hypothetical protein